MVIRFERLIASGVVNYILAWWYGTARYDHRECDVHNVLALHFPFCVALDIEIHLVALPWAFTGSDTHGQTYHVLHITSSPGLI